MKDKFFRILKDVITTKAYAVRTFASDPLQAYKFRVFISGIPSSIGFKSIGGLSREVAVVEYLENMFDYTHKLPGRETVGEITFERGMYPGISYHHRLSHNIRCGSGLSEAEIQV